MVGRFDGSGRREDLHVIEGQLLVSTQCTRHTKLSNKATRPKENSRGDRLRDAAPFQIYAIYRMFPSIYTSLQNRSHCRSLHRRYSSDEVTIEVHSYSIVVPPRTHRSTPSICIQNYRLLEKVAHLLPFLPMTVVKPSSSTSSTAFSFFSRGKAGASGASPISVSSSPSSSPSQSVSSASSSLSTF